MSDACPVDARRRFGGVDRLCGPGSVARLGGAHIAIAGIGGVGSWCAEALARSGVGALTLIDFDQVGESNVNRQLHALTETLGASKVDVMARRIGGINPLCRVNVVDDFVTAGNAHEILPGGLTLLVDCTDQVAAKVAMVIEAAARGLALVVCGGAGGKTDALSLRAGDLSQAANDALLAKLRNTLRRRHGYPKASDRAGRPRRRIPKMDVRAVWFDQVAHLPFPEAVAQPAAGTSGVASQIPSDGASDGEGGSPQGLSCAGYGSLVTVTATMGLGAAGQAIHYLLERTYPVNR